MSLKITRSALLFLGCLLLASTARADDKLRIWNLENESLFLAKGQLESGNWVSSGWYEIKPRNAYFISTPSNKSLYIRLTRGGKDVTLNAAAPSTIDSAGFWIHPTNAFSVKEQSNNSSILFLNGTRVSEATLRSQGYKYLNMYQFPQSGNVFVLAGSYWKWSVKDFGFSHSTGGDKSQTFSTSGYGPVIDYTYSTSCVRRTSGIDPYWGIKSDRYSVFREGPSLKSSTLFDPGTPCYNGMVRVYYTYR